MEFPGYRFGWNYRPGRGRAYIGNRPSKASVQSSGVRKDSQAAAPAQRLDQAGAVLAAAIHDDKFVAR